MVDIRVNEWRQLKYSDPEDVLRKFRAIEHALTDGPGHPRASRLRTALLKPLREERDAALFSLGMSHRLGCRVVFAAVEASDYDFVTCFAHEDTQHFVPVQLKELVPADLNPDATLADLLAKLRALPGKSDTALALRLNREGRSEFPPDMFAGLPFREAWLYWAASPDGKRWQMYGDVMSSPTLTEYSYPE